MGQSPLGFLAGLGRAGGAFANGVVSIQRGLWTAQRHGKYYASVYGGNGGAGYVYSGANASAVTLSAALATTYVGCCLSNPAGSAVNLAVKRVSGVTVVAPSAEIAFGLITGWAAGGITAHTTPITPNPTFVGANASGEPVAAPVPTGLVDAACTLVGTPVWSLWFSSSVAATTVGSAFSEQLDDLFIIPPGGYAAIGGSVAGGSSGFFGSIVWEELPI